MSRKQNWERRDICSYGPKFRIDTNNPQMGGNGTNVYALYATTDSKDINFSGLTECGTYRIWNDRAIEFIAGNKDSSDGVDIVIAGMSGDVTITAMRNGAVKIKGKNIVIEADEDIDLKAGRNININGKSRVLIKGNKCEADGLLGNLVPDSFGALAFSKSFVGADIISSSFMAGFPNVIGTAQDIAIGAKDALSGGPGSLISGAAKFARDNLKSNLPIDQIAEVTLHTLQSPEDFRESLNSVITEK
jgi:hypothetical protein